MQKIDAVIFDLGGVILDIDYNLTHNAFEKLGVGNFDTMYSQAEADRLFRDLETGHIKEANFYIEFNKCTGLSLSTSEIRDAWNAMLLTFRENSLVFLDEISSKYRLFLLSNTNEIHYNMFKTIYYGKRRDKAFENFFEKAYYSFDMGMRKPDNEIYKQVLMEKNLNPQRTVFIDDSVQNVEAAAKVGIQTMLLKQGNYIENLGL